MGTSLIVSTGAGAAPMVKSLVRWWQIVWSFTVAATKTCKAMAFTCRWG